MPPSHPLVVTIHDLTPLLVPGRHALAAQARGLPLLEPRARPRSPTASSCRRCSPRPTSARLFPVAADKTRVTPDAADDFAAGADGPARSRARRGRRLALPAVDGLDPQAQGPADAAGRVRAHRRGAPGAAAAARGRRRPRASSTPSDGVRQPLSASASCSPAASTTRSCARSTPARRLFAFPSRYEGFGLPPLEAMSFGAPVRRRRRGVAARGRRRRGAALRAGRRRRARERASSACWPTRELRDDARARGRRARAALHLGAHRRGDRRGVPRGARRAVMGPERVWREARG